MFQREFLSAYNKGFLIVFLSKVLINKSFQSMPFFLFSIFIRSIYYEISRVVCSLDAFIEKLQC